MNTPTIEAVLIALRDMHIAANALLYAIDNDIELEGVMLNMREKIEHSQALVIYSTPELGS